MTNPDFLGNYNREELGMKKLLQVMELNKQNKIVLAGKFPDC
jgi:hypothetical protein